METFFRTLLENRRTKSGHYSGVSIFSNKIRCADCGGWYGTKIWHSTDRYRKVIYRCNQLFEEKEEIIANAQIIRDTLCATKKLEAEKSNLEGEMTVLVEMTQNIVSENARIAHDQNDYRKRYNELVEKYNRAKERYEEVTESISAKEAQSTRLAEFIKRLEAHDGILTKLLVTNGTKCSIIKLSDSCN